MTASQRLYDRLRKKYGDALPFKRICQDEGIEVLKGHLDDGVSGVYFRANGFAFIVLSADLSRSERRDWAWHELFHHFLEVSGSPYPARRNERQATIFAALCRIPSVKWGDTIEALVERYQVSPWLAKARLEHEARKLTG